MGAAVPTRPLSIFGDGMLRVVKRANALFQKAGELPERSCNFVNHCYGRNGNNLFDIQPCLA